MNVDKMSTVDVIQWHTQTTIPATVPATELSAAEAGSEMSN